MTLRVYIGHDERQEQAFKVAASTAQRFGSDVVPVIERRLRTCGMLTRPMDRRGGMWDLVSNAPQSTEFALTRFFVPLLAHAGWCLFVDSDVVFLSNPSALMRWADESKAVMVVKHGDIDVLSLKMDVQVQKKYARKLWSSVILWNLEHPGNKRVNLQMLNQWPRDDLHAFGWLADDEIGDLPPEWNHLVGLMPYSDDAKLIHFTMGTPDMAGYEESDYADAWRAACAEC